MTADVDLELLAAARRRTTTYGPADDAPDTTVIELEIPESLRPATLERPLAALPFVPDDAHRSERCEEILAIQCCGLARRLEHTACRKAVIGISGGLDSTLALLATVRTFDRLGLDRRGIVGITMPGFGTSTRTHGNAVELMRELGVTAREIPIGKACEQHFADIGLDPADRSAAYENAQARERTQILMDTANMEGALVIGTGDLSELALGWATYNGDQMSMYGLNASVPKTLVLHLVRYEADRIGGRTGAILHDVCDTPVSPELLPAQTAGEIAQKTEELVGPYELHDFFLYHFLRPCGRADVLRLPRFLDALTVYRDRRDYPHKLCNAIEAYGLGDTAVNSHRAVDDARATVALLRAMAAEREDLERYIGLFGTHPKYGLSGRRISSVTYRPQSYQRTGPLVESTDKI